MHYNGYKTLAFNTSACKKAWFIVDANEQTLGRLASQIAHVIRGKHKPKFTPNMDCGDNVIVINASKVRLTGKKWDKRNYIRHTGYPGGQRIASLRDVHTRSPIQLVKRAVQGMLPKGKLGRALLSNLCVYPDATHKHQAQQPKAYILPHKNS